MVDYYLRKSWKDWTDLHICFQKSSSFSQLSKTDHEVKRGFEHYYLEALNLTDPFRTNTNPVVLENYIKPLLWPQTPVSTHTVTFTVCFILLVSPTCSINFDLSDNTHTKLFFFLRKLNHRFLISSSKDIVTRLRLLLEMCHPCRVSRDIV